MLRRIVVPLDGSASAEKVLPYALALAIQFQAEILLLYVSKRPDTAGERYLQELEKALNLDNLPDSRLSYAIHRFAARVQSLPQNTERLQKTQLLYRLTTAVVNGDPVSQISRIAHNQQGSLIFISTALHNESNSLFNSAMATRLIHESHLPVMQVAPKFEPKISLPELFEIVPPNFLYKPILVPLDGSPLAECALKFTQRATQNTAAPVILMEVIPTEEQLVAQSIIGGLGYFPCYPDTEEMSKKALQYLNRVGTDYLNSTPEERVRRQVVIEDKVAQEIARQAHRSGAGLIVMASHARTGFAATLLRSVTQVVVRESNLPVLIATTRTHLEDADTIPGDFQKTPEVAAKAS